MGPRRVHPAGYVDGVRQADETVTAEARQLTPADVGGFVEWVGVETTRAPSGGVELVAQGVTFELGDFAVRHEGGLAHEPADGFWHRYAPAPEPTDA